MLSPQIRTLNLRFGHDPRDPRLPDQSVAKAGYPGGLIFFLAEKNRIDTVRAGPQDRAAPS